MRPRIRDVRIEAVPDCDPDPSYLEQEGFEDHKAAFERGDFGFVGVRIVVETEHQINKGVSILHTFESPGLWGIESDSGSDCIAEVAREEAETLKGELRAYNVDLKGFREMFKVALASL